MKDQSIDLNLWDDPDKTLIADENVDDISAVASSDTDSPTGDDIDAVMLEDDRTPPSKSSATDYVFHNMSKEDLFRIIKNGLFLKPLMDLDKSELKALFQKLGRSYGIDWDCRPQEGEDGKKVKDPEGILKRFQKELMEAREVKGKISVKRQKT